MSQCYDVRVLSSVGSQIGEGMATNRVYNSHGVADSIINRF